MILKLRNGNITVEHNRVPERVNNIVVMYDFETGTNHYDVKLTVDDSVVHYGNNLVFKYDSPKDKIDLKVELLDTHNTVMRVYTGSFNYYKMSAIGDDTLINVYKELDRLYAENKKLKEQGEVI